MWIHDTLPDELTGWLSTAMDQIAPVFQRFSRPRPRCPVGLDETPQPSDIALNSDGGKYPLSR